ncbi:hypothetical protein As57867_007165, partial [Aphanomyces stellatus]
MHIISWPYALPIRTYVAQAFVQPDKPVAADANIMHMRVSNKKLVWHPDNMTLTQIVEVIQATTALALPPPDDQVEAIAVLSDHLKEEFRTPTDQTKADDLWQWISRSPLHANVMLTTLLMERQPAFDRIVRLHAWHRWIVASSVPQTTTFLQGFQHIFGVKPTWDFMTALVGTPDFISLDTAVPGLTM